MAAAQIEGADEEPVRPLSIEELFLALESPLLNYARRLAPNHDMAEDLVQEAFVRLHAQTTPLRSPKSWLYRTVHNLALNHLRSQKRIVPLQPVTEEAGGQEHDFAADLPLPDEQLLRWEGIGLVRLSLKGLDARDQELIRLKFTEELSYKEISQRTGLSVGNVAYKLHHALKALAADLAKGGFQP